MNSLIDNYDFNKEAEEIRKRQNKIFSIDNQTKIEDWYKKGLLKVEKRLYEKIQKTYSNLEIRKIKFRNSILRILDELEKEQIENGLNPLFIPIINYICKLYFYETLVVDPISSVFDDMI